MLLAACNKADTGVGNFSLIKKKVIKSLCVNPKPILLFIFVNKSVIKSGSGSGNGS